jgi:molybdopterin molybdotransferase
MPEFLTLQPPDAALKMFLEKLPNVVGVERITSKEAINRVIAESILAPHSLPEFPRTTVDGYAVIASDTYGASESLPAYLKLIGEIRMGSDSGLSISSGECALIHTGGMVPAGADAIVMVEYTQVMGEKEVEILRSVAVGENIIEVGEDVQEGEEVIPIGKRLRPADIGGLLALGFTKVNVAKKPIVGIISTGDEVVEPNQKPEPGQVRDINSYTLSSLVKENWGVTRLFGIIQDNEHSMLETAFQAMQQCDMVVITAGSSASFRDLTSRVVQQLGNPGVLVHGVNVKPGKPTILAVCDGKPVIGLPGNPVSALVIAGLFVRPTLHFLSGEKGKQPKFTTSAKLSTNLSSQSGREEWIPVRLVQGETGFMADPIFGRSNLIFSLAKGDGLIHIQPNATGYVAGETVEVFPL